MLLLLLLLPISIAQSRWILDEPLLSFSRLIELIYTKVKHLPLISKLIYLIKYEWIKSARHLPASLIRYRSRGITIYLHFNIQTNIFYYHYYTSFYSFYICSIERYMYNVFILLHMFIINYTIVIIITYVYLLLSLDEYWTSLWWSTNGSSQPRHLQS